MDLGQWLQDNRLLLLYITGGLVVLVLLQKIVGIIRRRRNPAPLHPKLQPYAGRNEADLEAERREAAKIIATSSTGTVAGYKIIQQIEAVFVEGYRTPQDATTALKASAARAGANAIINLMQQRTAAGRCTAQGDAVRIRLEVAERERQPDR